LLNDQLKGVQYSQKPYFHQALLCGFFLPCLCPPGVARHRKKPATAAGFSG